MNAKKWLSMVLILSFVLVLCPMLTPVHAEEVSGATPAADSAPNTPNEFTGEAVTDGFQGGDGTAENPYQIATLAQLQYFANYVNEGNTPADGAMQHFALTHDIVVNESFTQWVFGTNPSKIATADNVPFIGTETAPFYGHFDGNGKTIFGYYRNTQLANSGLFGWGKGVIENLNMDTLYMTTGAQSSALLSIATGDITIRNCSVTNAFILSKGTCGGILGYGNAVGSTIVIDGCTYQGKINGNLNYSGIGGIMQSYIHSVKSVSITNCHTNADLVNSQWDGASGILHTANYTTDNPGVLISDCTFRGSIQSGCYKSVGGILANANNAYRIPNTSTDVRSDIIIQNCVNYGTLYANAQGVAGGICATVSGKSPLTVENCYNFGTLSANASNSYTLAGIVGDASANSTLEMANCANYGDIVAKAAAPTLVAGGLIGKQQPGWPSANICIYNCA
ncbi:MAG: hypothetical protein J6R42_02755, partial [Clostridia bacterium]|nr:hypothetical protein [Clostridia bacterium]